MSVKTRATKRSPKRSREFWIRSMLHRSEPMPRINVPLPRAGEGGSRRQAAEGGGTVSDCAVSWHRPSPRPSPASGRGRYSPRLVHQAAHPCDARLEAAEDRLAYQKMADVELPQLRD